LDDGVADDTRGVSGVKLGGIGEIKITASKEVLVSWAGQHHSSRTESSTYFNWA
jgi:hypothetical protein